MEIIDIDVHSDPTNRHRIVAEVSYCIPQDSKVHATKVVFEGVGFEAQSWRMQPTSLLPRYHQEVLDEVHEYLEGKRQAQRHKN